MPVEIPVGLQPELVPLAWLIGAWEGRGAVAAPEAAEREIAQRLVFEQVEGQPYLLYRCETWLLEPAEGGAARGAAPDAQAQAGPVLGVETGFWQLARERGDHDTGPGLLPPSGSSPYTSAEAVEALRSERGDFAVEAALAYPHGVMEHYSGRIYGPRVDLVSDGGVRTPGAKRHRGSSRMYGLVNGDLLWAWDIAVGDSEPTSHVSAQLSRVTPSVLE